MGFMNQRYRKIIAVSAMLALMLCMLGFGGAEAETSNKADPNLHVVVRGEHGPMLFIGGNMGLFAEVFFGDMPYAPDPFAPNPGDDTPGVEEPDDNDELEGNSNGVDEPGAGPGAGSGSLDDSNPDESGSYEKEPGESYLPPEPKGLTLPSIHQNLNLILDARFGEAVQAYTRLTMSGVWGVSRPSDASPWMPSMVRPLLIDEAWVRYSTADFQVQAGKQRFSLGPIGLLGRTDLEPAEGIVIETGAENWGVLGVWSRLSSGYYYNSSFVTRADNLWAFRLVWPVADTWTLGLNYLADGLGDETGVSLDFLGNVGGRNIAAEIGIFESSSTLYPEYRTSGWVPGLVVKAEALNTPQHRLEFSYGYLAKGFAPYYSSVASRSGGSVIPFDENTQGIAVTYDRRLSPSTEVNLTAARLGFLDREAAYGEQDSIGEHDKIGDQDNVVPEHSEKDNNSNNGIFGDKRAESGSSEVDRAAEPTKPTVLMTQSAATPVLLGSASVRHELRPHIFLEGRYEHWWMESGSNYGRLTGGVTVDF